MLCIQNQGCGEVLGHNTGRRCQARLRPFTLLPLTFHTFITPAPTHLFNLVWVTICSLRNCGLQCAAYTGVYTGVYSVHWSGGMINCPVTQARREAGCTTQARVVAPYPRAEMPSSERIPVVEQSATLLQSHCCVNSRSGDLWIVPLLLDAALASSSSLLLVSRRCLLEAQSPRFILIKKD